MLENQNANHVITVKLKTHKSNHCKGRTIYNFNQCFSSVLKGQCYEWATGMLLGQVGENQELG